MRRRACDMFRRDDQGKISAARDGSAVNYDKEEDGRWRRRRCDDGGGEDVGSPERQGRIGGFHVADAVPRTRKISAARHRHMTVDGDDGDGRATDGGRVRRTAWWCGSAGAVRGSGGLRALTVRTADLRCVKMSTDFFGDKNVPERARTEHFCGSHFLPKC